ncbi:polysaccharide deacetylase family protein [Lachnospiraceae bacterium ZAX-1]
MKGFMKNITKSIVAMSLIFLCTPSAVLANEGNWGLGYGTSGAKPTGNTSAEKLKEHDAFFVGSGDDKVIYLTFDAGYENGYTKEILNVLKESSVPATFFLVGTYVRDNPALVKQMIAEGHIVGNHTMHHPDMSALSSKEAFAKELAETEEHFFNVTGKQMSKFYRPPQGKYSESNLKMAKELGYKTIFWSLAYVDWNVNDQPTKEQAFAKLIPRVHPGTILLLHSTSKTNAKILKDLIAEYRGMGYEFKSLEGIA